MNIFKSCLLMELLVPVTCSGMGLVYQNTCYILDGILIVYCIVVTALLFREKMSNPPLGEEQDEGGEGLYQELVREGNADQYEVLNPLRARAIKEKTKFPLKMRGIFIENDTAVSSNRVSTEDK